MIIRRTHLAPLASILMFLSGIESSVAAAIDETLAVRDGALLTLVASSSQVHVRGGAPDGVRVRISRGMDDADDIEKDFEIEFKTDASGVSVEIKRRRKSSWFGWWKRGLTVDIDLPQRFDLNVRTSGGSIDIRNVTGAMETRASGGRVSLEAVDGPIYARTSGGSIQLDGTSADANLETSGGSVRVGEIGGKLDARASGGGITVERVRGPVVAKSFGGRIKLGTVLDSITANSSGGGIEVTLAAQPTSDSQISSSGGAVTILLSQDVAITLDAQASGGRVNTDIPVAIRGNSSKRRLEGEINGGGPSLRVSASGGSVNLRKLQR